MIQEHLLFSESGPIGTRGGELLHPSDGTSLPFLPRFSWASDRPFAFELAGVLALSPTFALALAILAEAVGRAIRMRLTQMRGTLTWRPAFLFAVAESISSSLSVFCSVRAGKTGWAERLINAVWNGCGKTELPLARPRCLEQEARAAVSDWASSSAAGATASAPRVASPRRLVPLRTSIAIRRPRSQLWTRIVSLRRARRPICSPGFR